jgi:hypothetical protein
MAKSEPFGQIAVRMGFVTDSQVQAALEVQRSLESSGKPRRLLGMIMIETGLISTEQLIAILKYYETVEEVERIARKTRAEVSGETPDRSDPASTDRPRSG